jgi:hypothetical protein
VASSGGEGVDRSYLISGEEHHLRKRRPANTDTGSNPSIAPPDASTRAATRRRRSRAPCAASRTSRQLRPSQLVTSARIANAYR